MGAVVRGQTSNEGDNWLVGARALDEVCGFFFSSASNFANHDDAFRLQRHRGTIIPYQQ